jgi:uncharacterized membrane protein YoaK (UPF0700 family)
MPLNYSRRLTGNIRSRDANRQLGCMLAFIAGAVNAGGFLAVQHYTSHMTGIVSAMADQLVLGMYGLVLVGLSALLAFLLGATASTVLVRHSRRRQRHSEYALPLLVEAGLLLCFGLLGSQISGFNGFYVSATVMLLSFIMGLQNAVISKLSNAEIRTTHITGVVTDIGIELGKLLYRAPALSPAQAPPDGARLRLLTLLALCFFIGGVTGALGFKHIGYAATVPLAVTLMALCIIPIADDVQDYLRGRSARRP